MRGPEGYGAPWQAAPSDQESIIVALNFSSASRSVSLPKACRVLLSGKGLGGLEKPIGLELATGALELGPCEVLIALLL